MSFNVPNSFQVAYKNNVELALNQNQSVLLGAVVEQSDASSEKVKIKDIVGNTAPNEGNERHGDTRYNNPTYDGVWLAKPNELYYADLVDNDDQLATQIDIMGTSTMSSAGTIQRAYDQRILEGFYGSIISGKTGTTTTPFPNGQIIPVTTGGAAGAQRMNTAKLRAATKLLLQGYVDPNEEKYMVLTAEQNDDLLTEIPATHADFQRAFGGVVQNGMLMEMLGWKFLHLELANPLLGTIAATSLDGSGYRKTPFWTKKGLVANFWQKLRTDISPVPTKRLARQIYAGTTVAASRTQPGFSGIILNSEA